MFVMPVYPPECIDGNRTEYQTLLLYDLQRASMFVMPVYPPECIDGNRTETFPARVARARRRSTGFQAL